MQTQLTGIFIYQIRHTLIVPERTDTATKNMRRQVKNTNIMLHEKTKDSA